VNITLHVSDGLSVHHQEFKTVWHIPDAVCTALNSWWWTERPAETCRVVFNKLEKNCASSWFYYRNVSQCTVPWTSNFTMKLTATATWRACRNYGFHTRFLRVRHAGSCSSLAKVNPLNPELNPICYLLALLGAHHFLHVSRIRVKILTFGRLMSYIYGAPILDVSRSHTTTQHSR